MGRKPKIKETAEKVQKLDPLNSSKKLTPGKNGINLSSGVHYQYDLIYLHAVRAFSKKYEFEINTEIVEGEKFDDLLFLWKTPGESDYYISFLQAKHSRKLQESVTWKSLFYVENYDLFKYFKSYRNILEKFHHIGDLIICTSKKVDPQVEKYLVPVSNHDIFDGVGKCFKFNKDCKVPILLAFLAAEFCDRLKAYNNQDLIKNVPLKYGANSQRMKNYEECVKDGIFLKAFKDQVHDYLWQGKDEAMLINFNYFKNAFLKNSIGIDGLKEIDPNDVWTQIYSSNHVRSYIVDFEKIRNDFDDFLEKLLFVFECDHEEIDRALHKDVRNITNLEDVELIVEFLRKETLQWIRKSNKGHFKKELFESYIAEAEAKIYKQYCHGYLLGKLEQHFLEFNLTAFDKDLRKINEFSKSNINTSLIVVSSDIKRRTLKIYQVLKFLGYTFEEILYFSTKDTQKHIDNCTKFFEADKFKMCLIEANGHFYIPQLKTSPHKKAIIISSIEYSGMNCYQPEEMKCTDLTDDSLQKLIETNTVEFQGKRLKWECILSTAEAISANLSLTELLDTKNKNIDEKEYEMKPCDCYCETECNNNCDCRCFKDCECNQGLFIERFLKKDGKKHSFEAILKFVANQCKIFYLSGDPGLGKTMYLRHLHKKLKDKYPNYWIKKINLMDERWKFENHKEKFDTLTDDEDKKRLNMKFLSEKLLGFYPKSLELRLFKEFYENSKKVILIFDAMDDISPDFTQEMLIFVNDILTGIKNLTVCITSRPELDYKVQKNLTQSYCALEKFKFTDQYQFLTNYWMKNLNLLYKAPNKESKLMKIARNVITQLSYYRNPSDNLATIPLMLKLLGSFVEKELLKNSSETDFDFSDLKLTDLYETFIESQFKIYVAKNLKNVHPSLRDPRSRFDNFHSDTAIKQFEYQFKVKFTKLLQDQEYEDLGKKCLKVGLVSRFRKNWIFSHKSFAEYYFAKYLKDSMKTKKIAKILIEKIFYDVEFKLMRTFLNQFLLDQTYNSILYFYGNLIIQQNETCKRKESIFHINATENNQNILIFLVKSLISTNDDNSIKNILSARNEGETFLNIHLQNCKNIEFFMSFDYIEIIEYLLLLENPKDSNSNVLLEIFSNKKITEDFLEYLDKYVSDNTICELIISNIQSFHNLSYKNYFSKILNQIHEYFGEDIVKKTIKSQEFASLLQTELLTSRIKEDFIKILDFLFKFNQKKFILENYLLVKRFSKVKKVDIKFKFFVDLEKVIGKENALDIYENDVHLIENSQIRKKVKERIDYLNRFLKRTNNN